MRDDETFTTFVSTHWGRLFRLAYLLTGSSANAEDLVQTALEKVYVHWARISGSDNTEAYVRKVVVTTSISTQRRSARRPEVLHGDPPEVGVASGEERAADHAALWPLVCALPERQRAVVVLRYYEDLSEQQIADAMGCSRGTVKSQASDALRALRRSAAFISFADATAASPQAQWEVQA